MTPGGEPPGLESVEYAIRDEQRAITKKKKPEGFSKNEVAGPKRQQCSGVGVSGGGSKVQCYKAFCIGYKISNSGSFFILPFFCSVQSLSRV